MTDLELYEKLRVLLKGGLPSINSVVDSCNLASLQTLMPIGIFDADKTIGGFILDLSDAGEEYEPIGMDKWKTGSALEMRHI